MSMRQLNVNLRSFDGTMNENVDSAAPNLSVAIAASAWLTTVLNEYPSHSSSFDDRERVVISLLKICREHRDAVVVMIHLGGRTSAPVVARSAFEAYVLALWASQCEDVERLKRVILGQEKKGQFPTLKKAIQDLKKAMHPLCTFIADLHPIYSALSDYAHGYGRQISRWIELPEIVSTHSDIEMMELILFVDSIAVLAAISQERVCEGDVETGARLLRLVLSRSYFDVNGRHFQ